MSEIEERVQRGIRLLDERRPGWRKSIDLDKLNLGDGCNCVLGQVYGNYLRGFYALDFEIDEMEVRDEAYGFDVLGKAGIDDVSYAELTKAWVDALS